MKQHGFRVLDLDIDIPAGFQVKVGSIQSCRAFYALEGQAVAGLLAELEELGVRAGYARRQVGEVTILERGEQKIEMYLLDSGRLGIRVDDAEALPRAGVVPGGLTLAGVTLPVPSDLAIAPGRERHDPGTSTWSAEWRILDANVAELVQPMHDALIRLGLRSGGIWPPPKGGGPRWKIEASSMQMLVQVGITEGANCLDVEAHVVRD